MILIIDGYNLLFHESWPFYDGLLEDRRNNLIQLVATYRRVNDIRRAIIVFDGCAGVGPYSKEFEQSGIEIIYAICQGKADEKIISINRVLNDVYIVTADRGLAKKAKRHKTNIISPEAFTKDLFLQKSSQAKDVKPTVATDDIDAWLEEFGMEDEVEIPDTPQKNIPPIPKKINYIEEKPQKQKQQDPKKKTTYEDEKEGLLNEASVEEWLHWFQKNEKKEE